MKKLAIIGIVISLTLVACAGSDSISRRKGYNRDAFIKYDTETKVVGKVYEGEVSYYGPGFHGKLTANGETYDQNAFTCAHKTLPFGTKLRITNLSNNKSIVLRVNDRGPYKHGRIVDLSVAGAKAIGLDVMGVAKARVEVVE
ncbi:MAG: septal ring lytic transglycosylase RlpA family protein [Fibrobacterales bacterium]